MDELNLAIKTRGQVVGDYKTSIDGKQFLGEAEQDSEYPYVVFTILNGVPEYTFSPEIASEAFEDFLVQFNIYSQNTSSEEAGTILRYLKAHYDNISLSVSGFKNMDMTRTNVFGPLPEKDEGLWVYVVEYRIHLQGSDS